MANAAYSYDDPFRPIYEYYPAYAWFAVGMLAIVMAILTQYPKAVLMVMAGIAFTMAGVRGVKALQLHKHQADLNGQELMFMTRSELREICHEHNKESGEPAIFLGYGFTWSQEQAQIVHVLKRNNPEKLKPPEDQDMGLPWIHGIGMHEEKEIWLPLEHTAGHTLLVGTTRSGKTRVLDSIVAQAVDRNEPVIIWDPKGDKGLMDAAQKACISAGRPNDFVYFHPAFPEKSYRIDPLANFSRETELATRIASLIASESTSDPFTAFSQKILTNLCAAMLMVHTKPTIKLLKHYVDAGPEKLVVKASEVFFEKHYPGVWRDMAHEYVIKAKKKNDRELGMAYVEFYRAVVMKDHQSMPLDGIYSDFEHEKAHLVKMIASLAPVLTMLTAGPLGDLLSPDPENQDDLRPITNFAQIIRNGQCCYIGLDSLSDNMVGSALGSMFVSDLAAVSGNRYNYGNLDELPAVNLIIDEAAELVSDKMIQLLNKSGGAKFRLILATQTFADFAAKVGSNEKARQILGNLNNIIALRIIDADTQTYVTESLPEVYVRHIEYTQQTDVKTSDVVNFGFRTSEAMKETAVPLVDAQLFGSIPNLQFFAKTSAGQFRKCRMHILIDDEKAQA